MKKALIVSTVSRQFSLFERGNIKILNELGYEVHCVANYGDATDTLNELNIIRHHIDIERSPFSIKQIKSYNQLKQLMMEQKFDLVHCHAPMGGVLGRLCAKATKTEPVLYTAHGFHFYKGAPFINNIVYKTIEKYMARYTDILLTMNSEDYESAKKFKFRNEGKVIKIPGVGVDIEYIKTIVGDSEIKRAELNIKENDFVLISVGELNENKNQQVIIESISKMTDDERNNIKYLVCGTGDAEESLIKIIKEKGLEENVFLLGYRNDVIELLNSSDVFIFPSKREGLSKSIMEAMVVGKPIICSKIRGNIDLVDDNKGGYLCEYNNINQFKNRICLLAENKKLCKEMGKYNQDKIIKNDVLEVNKIMKKVYKSITEEK